MAAGWLPYSRFQPVKVTKRGLEQEGGSALSLPPCWQKHLLLTTAHPLSSRDDQPIQTGYWADCMPPN
ncbi:hypothetical protein ES705_04699 [subsurface metagenome]